MKKHEHEGVKMKKMKFVKQMEQCKFFVLLYFRRKQVQSRSRHSSTKFAGLSSYSSL